MTAAIGAVTSVIGLGTAIKGQQDTKDAQQEAARKQEEAARLSAEELELAGREAEADILRQQQEAAKRVSLGTEEAAARLDPLIGPGLRGFEQARALTDGGQLTGPLADAIRLASIEGAQSPALNIGSPVTQRAIQEQGGLAVSRATPAITQNLLTAGQGGISALQDVAGIRSRGLERLADIAGATGAQRSSVLVGQAPQLQQLGSQQGQARLLGQVAGQQAQTAGIESLAGLAGELL